VPALTGIEQEMDIDLGLGLTPNSFGRFKVSADVPGVISTEILRLKQSVFNPFVIDNAASLPVR
jgi:hypothetical protein